MRNDIQKFHETVAILVKAFIEGTLEHGNCAACAVGNIIQASGMPLPYASPNDIETMWLRYIDRHIRGKNPPARFGINYEVAKLQIEVTGYSANELSLIEMSFEAIKSKADIDMDDEQIMFGGLMSVVDVLAEIHGIDLSVKEEAKALFVK